MDIGAILVVLDNVAHTFHLPKDLEDELRMEAVKNRVRFSDVAILVIREFLLNSKVKGAGKK